MASRLLSTQLHYDTFEKELMAIYSAIVHFKSHLLTRPFLVHTDHRNLTFLRNSTTPKHSAGCLPCRNSTLLSIMLPEKSTLWTTPPMFEPPNYMKTILRPLTNTSAFNLSAKLSWLWGDCSRSNVYRTFSHVDVRSNIYRTPLCSVRTAGKWLLVFFVFYLIKHNLVSAFLSSLPQRYLKLQGYGILWHYGIMAYPR